MMSACPPIERLEELIALDAGDPRRAHLESCPRCRSRMLAFTSFMEVHPVPDGARLEDARKRLSKVLREEVASRAGDAPSAAQASTATERRPRRGLRLLLDWLAPRPRQVAVGLAALAVAVVVIIQVREERQDGSPLHLRGPEAPGWMAAAPGLHSVRADGALELRWPAMEGAEGYRLVFSGPELMEILRIEAGADTQYVLPAETVSELGSTGSTVFWRVQALRGGDTITQSPPGTLTLP